MSTTHGFPSLLRLLEYLIVMGLRTRLIRLEQGRTGQGVGRGRAVALRAKARASAAGGR